MNIPIYRAKKIDSDKMVIGFYFDQEWTGDFPTEDSDEREEKIKHFIVGGTTHDTWEDEEGHFQFMGVDEIDPSTLAIHFPDMIDSKGTRIFASLSEDGKGGDKVFYEDGLETFVIEFDFASGVSMYEYLYDDEGNLSCKNFVKKFDCNSIFANHKVTGIHSANDVF